MTGTSSGPPQTSAVLQPPAPHRPDLAQALVGHADAGRRHWSTPAGLLHAAPRDLLVRTDTEHVGTQALRRIVATHRWPGHSLVGGDGCQAAVEIAVHADHDPAFQRLLLRLLADAVRAGEARHAQWAHLYDRCQARAGKRQLYGTQYQYLDDGQLVLHPLADPERVDDWRRRVGLEDLNDQLARMRLHHTGSPIDRASGPAAADRIPEGGHERTGRAGAAPAGPKLLHPAISPLAQSGGRPVAAGPERPRRLSTLQQRPE